jgi:hypothetical protein
MDQAHRRPALEVAVPVQQTALVGMGGEAADGVHFRGNLVVLAPEPDLAGAIHQRAAGGAAGLEAHDHHVGLAAPDIVLEVVLDAPAGAHAAAGDDDGA